MTNLVKMWKQTLVLFVAVALVMGFLTLNWLCAFSSGLVVALCYNAALFLGNKP